MKMLAILVAATLIGLPSTPTFANPILNQADAARQIAEKVAFVIENNREVFVREFRGFGEHHVGLAKLVGESLSEHHKVVIRRGASVEVEGRLFRFPKDLGQPLEGYSINVTVVMAGSERRFSFDVENRDEGHIAIGQSGEKSAPPNKPHGSLPDESGPVLDGSIIRPSRNSPYGVEFLRERHGSYETIQPHIDGSRIRIPVEKGDLIACRLHNTSNYEAAVDVLIDGLSRFALADDPKRRASLDIVAHAKPRIIKGYYRDEKLVDAFRVGEYSKSVAAALLPEGKDHGTITIAFRAAWTGQQQPPNDAGFSSRSFGIERGPQRDDRTRHVIRNIGKVRAVVKASYGT